jgi:thymidylate kinase
MANSKLIVIEGAQGAGKTTITDYLRNSIKYTNLYRLCGTSDSTPSGLQKAVDMYTVLLEYIKKLENKSINLLFDRTFFTEENYCRLGKKEYSFTEAYNTFLENFANLDFEIYYITLYLEDENQYNERIKRDGKCEPEYAKFKAENSIEQQKVYLEMAEEIKEKYPKIKVLNMANDRDIEIVKKELKEFIEF